MKQLFAHTGRVYAPLSLLSRFPYAMTVVGVLTLAVSARHSVELGGLTSAMIGLGIACFGPLIGAAADRFGQRPTLLIFGAVNSAALGTLAWVAYSPLPDWSLLLASFVVGATVPQTSPMSRSRLVSIIHTRLPVSARPRTISSVLAFESAADEVVFVFGPVIVGVLASLFGAWAPIAGAAVLTLVFVTAFALHPTSAPPKSAAERALTLAPASQLWRPALLITVAGVFATGMFFGSTLTSLTSYMADRGNPDASGLLYGVMGVGSAVLAVGVAWFPARFTPRARWLVFAAAIITGALLLQTVQSITTLVLALALMGVGIGPLLVTLYGFGAARTPEGRSATVMTMLGSGIMVGQSFAAAVTGIVAQHFGTDAALMMPLLAAMLMLVTGIANACLPPHSR